ncbi:MAG: MBL fold metallo-hydrolase [bacterium]|nr:MBL fold metallo-hydrolase [bacterium]
MKITMLGTGNALVTECYNTCFVLEDDGRYFMVDGGGGNGVLRQLKSAGLRWQDMRHIFVTHKHLDHLLGILWMVRMICQYMHGGKYNGEAYIYAHDEVIGLLRGMAQQLLPAKITRFLGERLRLIEVHDGEQREINGFPLTFFDIHSTKAKQFGFALGLGGEETLTCCGDEPYAESEKPYAAGSKWLLHEAFCLHSQADIFSPYEKHHSTVKDACELAERLGVKNLLLYHTEDANLSNRKALYSAEGQRYYQGNLYIPDDLETLEL